MLNDTAYHLIASLLEALMWDGELVGEENLKNGPGVIVANHMGAIGPVGLCCALPMRLYPWVLGATVHPVEGPETVRKEFVERVFKVGPPLSYTVAKGLCKISIPLLLSLGCIPVPAARPEQEYTFRRSIELLKQGKFLLIVPEDPNREPDPVTGIKPFKHGFLRLGELYARETGKRLPFYPVAIHESGLVFVGVPFEYGPLSCDRTERLHMANLLEAAIKKMYWQATENTAAEHFNAAPKKI